MKLKRLGVILVVLAGLLLLAAALPFLRSNEPAYEGKTVSAWFKEYAHATNATTQLQLPNLTVQGRAILLRAMSNGANIKMLQALTNQLFWVGGIRPEMAAPREPAWKALQALGSNAVPCLVHHLSYSPVDRAYERAVTNLPAFLQRRLPNPLEKRWYRIRALQTLAALKDSARGATPALLDLLRKPEPLLRSQVLTTLRSIYADRHSISGLLLQLGEQKRYSEVLEIARETKWEGREAARLFGEILQATNTALHRDAIRLLEESGERAAPALDGILVALRSTDGEVRYLATRTIESIGRKVPPEAQPPMAAALEASLNDEKDSVRNVARRALAKLNNAAEAPAESARRRHPEEVEHEGKKVEQWFQDYIASRDRRIPGNASPVMNGEFLPRTPVHNQPDPAWAAFQVMDEKAIPGLLRHLDSSGEPATSEQAQLAQSQAIDLIHRLGPVARSAAPALLALLKQGDESEIEAVCAAIQNVRAEQRVINQFLLDLGKEHRDAEMLRFARRLGWSGSEVAQLLGGLLRSPDREVSHDAAALLEAAGPDAQAAVEQIAGALQNADQDIRYLAARSLAGMATNTPAARKALQGLIDDQNEMVRRVARRAVP